VPHQTVKVALEMAKIRKDFAADHYFMLGANLGELLNTLTAPKPALFTIDEVMEEARKEWQGVDENDEHHGHDDYLDDRDLHFDMPEDRDHHYKKHGGKHHKKF